MVFATKWAQRGAKESPKSPLRPLCALSVANTNIYGISQCGLTVNWQGMPFDL